MENEPDYQRIALEQCLAKFRDIIEGSPTDIDSADASALFAHIEEKERRIQELEKERDEIFTDINNMLNSEWCKAVDKCDMYGPAEAAAISIVMKEVAKMRITPAAAGERGGA